MANSGYSQSECLPGGDHSSLHSLPGTSPSPGAGTSAAVSGLINSSGGTSSATSSSSSSTNIELSNVTTTSSVLQSALNLPLHSVVYQQQNSNQYCETLSRPSSTHTPLTSGHHSTSTPPPPLPSASAPPHLSSVSLPPASTFRNVHSSQMIDYNISNDFTYQQSTSSSASAQSQHINNGPNSLSHTVLNLNRYSDDMNDIFQCGKCKIQYFTLKSFVHHRSSDECLTQLQYSSQASQPKKHYTIDCNSNKISLGNGSNGTSGLVPLESFSSLLNSTTGLVSTPFPLHHHQSSSADTQHQQSQQQQQSTLGNSTSYLSNSEQCNLNSTQVPILNPHYDNNITNVYTNVPLSSLTPSLDPRMISPSISPSLLHLQGGDVSSNTDDFSQYRLDDSELWPEILTTDFNGINFDQNQTQPQAGGLSNSQQIDKNPQTVFVSALMNNFHSTSPASFATMVHDLSEQTASGVSSNYYTKVVPRTSSMNSGQFTNPDRTSAVLDSNTFKPLDKSPDESSHITVNDSQNVLRCHEPEPVTVIHHQPDNNQGAGKSVSNKKNVLQIKSEPSSGTEQQASFNLLCNNNPLNVVSPPNVTISSETSLPNSTLVKQPQQRSEKGKQSKTPSKSIPSTPETQIRCEQCPLSFQREREYQNHMLFHNGDRRFHCLNCGKTFAKKSSLRKHILTHKQLSQEEIGDLMTKCDVNIVSKVKATGSAKSQQQQPSIAQNNNSSANSEHNNNMSVISTNDANQSHSSQEKSLPIIKQELIDDNLEPVAKKSRLNSAPNNFHTKSVVDPISEIFLHCNFASCDQIFESSAMLKHIQDDHGCALKENSGSEANGLGEETMETESVTNNDAQSAATDESKPTKFACPVCFTQFKTQKALNDHEARTTHKHECSVCLKIYLTDRHIKRHLKRHSDSTTPTCFVCSEVFDKLEHLRSHLGTAHGSGLKTCCCDICDASFSDLEQLKQHQQAHEPSVQHRCPVDGCFKGFNLPDKLKIHILTHYGLKSFPCGFCARSFTRQSNLLDHMKIHQKQDENCSEDDCRFDEMPIKNEPVESNTETFTTLENAATFPNTSDSSNSSSLVSGPTISSIVVPINSFPVFPTNQEQKIYIIFNCSKCKTSFFTQNDLEGHLCVPQKTATGAGTRSELTSSSIINAT